VQLLFLVRALDIRTLSIVRHNLILNTRKTTKVRLLVTATLLSISMQFARGIIWPSCLVDREQVSNVIENLTEALTWSVTANCTSMVALFFFAAIISSAFLVIPS